MRNIFTEHPHEVGETYFEHAKFAVGCGVNLLKLGFAAIIHGIFPFLFKTTVGDSLPEIANGLRSRRSDWKKFNKALDEFNL